MLRLSFFPKQLKAPLQPCRGLCWCWSGRSGVSVTQQQVHRYLSGHVRCSVSTSVFFPLLLLFCASRCLVVVVVVLFVFVVFVSRCFSLIFYFDGSCIAVCFTFLSTQCIEKQRNGTRARFLKEGSLSQRWGRRSQPVNVPLSCLDRFCVEHLAVALFFFRLRLAPLTPTQFSWIHWVGEYVSLRSLSFFFSSVSVLHRTHAHPHWSTRHVYIYT